MLDEVLVRNLQLLFEAEFALLSAPPVARIIGELGDNDDLPLRCPLLLILELAIELRPPRHGVVGICVILNLNRLLMPLGLLLDLPPNLDEFGGQHFKLGLEGLVVGESELAFVLLEPVVGDDEALLLLDDAVIVLDLREQPVLVLDDGEARRLLVHELLELEDSGPFGLYWLGAPLLWFGLLALAFTLLTRVSLF